MEKEVINQKQAIIIMSAYIVGSSAVIGTGSNAKQDVWLVYIIAMSAAALVFPIYARISKLYPQEEFSEILNKLFGKVGGRIIILIYAWYAFHLTALILRNFTEFVSTVFLNQAPPFIFAFIAVAITIWTVRNGIEVLGRAIGIFFPIFILLVLIVSILSTNLFNFNNLLPVLYDGIGSILAPSAAVFAYPFAETVLFLFVMGNLRKTGSPYKVYYASLLIGGGILILIALRTVMILGVPTIETQKYPSHSAVRLVDIGDFIQRIESTVAISFMITGYAKSSITLYCATKGLASAFNIKDYHKVVAPVGLLVALFSIFIYNNANEMSYWGDKIYGYYAIPFQILIPIIIWVAAEIKSRQKKASYIAPE